AYPAAASPPRSFQSASRSACDRSADTRDRPVILLTSQMCALPVILLTSPLDALLSSPPETSVLPSGEKATAYTSSWPSSLPTSLPDGRSHRRTVPSSPAQARVRPSGDSANH